MSCPKQQSYAPVTGSGLGGRGAGARPRSAYQARVRRTVISERGVAQVERAARQRSVVAMAVQQGAKHLGADGGAPAHQARHPARHGARDGDDRTRREPDPGRLAADPPQQVDRFAHPDRGAVDEVALTRCAVQLGQQVRVGAVVDVDDRDVGVHQDRKATVHEVQEQAGGPADASRSLHRGRVHADHRHAELGSQREDLALGEQLRALVLRQEAAAVRGVFAADDAGWPRRSWRPTRCGRPARPWRPTAARTTAAEPSTFACSMGPGSRWHIALMPATWKTVRTPRMPSSRAAGSSRSPRTGCAPRARTISAAASLRASALTNRPSATRRCTSAPPTNPDPPVTKTSPTQVSALGRFARVGRCRPGRRRSARSTRPPTRR